MQLPIFTRYEYVDATAFSNAASTPYANTQLLASSGLKPGLIHPEAMTFSSTGLNLTVTMPAPFAVMAASGVLAGAHGTNTNQDTQATVVNLASLVPGSGSITVYILASLTTIQQQPYTVIGPPPGHPSFDPTYVPATAYYMQVDTLALTASTTPADNAATYELCRLTLASGATTLPAVKTAYQFLAAALPYANTVSIGSNKTLARSDSGILQRADTANLYYTLPAAAASAGVTFTIVSRAAGTTLQISASGDLIYGLGYAPGTGQTSIAIAQGVAVAVVSDGVAWQGVAASAPAGSTGSLIGVQIFAVGGVYTYNSTPGLKSLIAEYKGSGGGGGGAPMPASGGLYVSQGGGGGEGAYGKLRLVTTAISVVVTVAQGAAGGNGSTGAGINYAGANGNTSSFGPYGSAPGGGGGTCNINQFNSLGGFGYGAAQAVGGNIINQGGAAGGVGFGNAAGGGFSGPGGGSGGGDPVINATGNGGNGKAPGAGGGGGLSCSAFGAANVNGGDSPDGYVIVWDYS